MIRATNPIVLLSWPIAMILSPEGLALQGQLAGIHADRFVLPLIAAAAIHGIHIATAPRSCAAGRHPRRLEAFFTSLLSLSVLPGVAVCLATATLVASGFVFNEIFAFWFPNFGFAALLLFTLLTLNIAGRNAASAAQILFTATALTGLAVLTLAGAFGQPPDMPAKSIDSPPLSPKGVGLFAIALLGYSLLRHAVPDPAGRRARAYMGIALTAGFMIVWSWNTIALTYVTPSRLADTTIPHILAARSIMGPPGRIIMGIVVISGSLAVVNLMFQAVARMLADMAKGNLIPSVTGVTSSRPWLLICALAGLTGLLMATGFAGSDWLDVSLRAGLILWVVGIGLDHLPPLLSRSYRHARRGVPAAADLALTVGMTALGIVLVMEDETPGMLVRALLALVAIAAVLTTVGLIAVRRRPYNRHRKPSYCEEGVLQ